MKTTTAKNGKEISTRIVPFQMGDGVFKFNISIQSSHKEVDLELLANNLSQTFTELVQYLPLPMRGKGLPLTAGYLDSEAAKTFVAGDDQDKHTLFLGVELIDYAQK